nr:MAG TPA: hypothetical protein [Caudoviricetes sp.]
MLISLTPYYTKRIILSSNNFIFRIIFIFV